MPGIFEASQPSEILQIHSLWQEAFEWTYYDQVIKGLQLSHAKEVEKDTPLSKQCFV